MTATRVISDRFKVPSLRHSAVELNEAAFLLGYEDSNSFFRAFQGWEGTSPGEWRTRHRSAELTTVAAR